MPLSRRPYNAGCFQVQGSLVLTPGELRPLRVRAEGPGSHRRRSGSATANFHAKCVRITQPASQAWLSPAILCRKPLWHILCAQLRVESVVAAPCTGAIQRRCPDVPGTGVRSDAHLANVQPKASL